MVISHGSGTRASGLSSYISETSPSSPNIVIAHEPLFKVFPPTCLLFFAFLLGQVSPSGLSVAGYLVTKVTLAGSQLKSDLICTD